MQASIQSISEVGVDAGAFALARLRARQMLVGIKVESQHAERSVGETIDLGFELVERQST